MAQPRESLKILLVQMRHDVITRQEEFDEFVRYSHLEAHQFTVLDAFAKPNFELSIVDGFSALFIGGSSDVSVIEPDRYPFIEPVKRLLVYCLDNAIPVFASCLGFQAAVEALGGKVILDKANLEMGTYVICLTEAAATDPLFHDAPDQFWAVSGHKERAIELPREAILLAYSELCPYHAFKIPGKPFYGFQFHPEVDAQDMGGRIARYQNVYLESDEQLARILASIRETPVSNELIRKFVDRVLLADAL